MKKRLLFYQLLKRVKNKEALIITGMRQVGKTTILKQIFEELCDQPKLWFDFENPIEMKAFEDDDYRVVYERLKNMAPPRGRDRLQIFVDEIQNFPAVTKVVKYLIDHYGVKFYLTGSSNFYLKNLFPESLSGRKFLYDLPPLTFMEYLYFKDKRSVTESLSKKKPFLPSAPIDVFLHKRYETDYDSYLQCGGFPAVVTAANATVRAEILKNIVKSFFEKDIKLLSDYKDVKDLRDLLLLLAPRVGSMLDVNKIAAEIGTNRVKIYHYLEFLQGAFVLRLLPKFSRSIDRTVAGGRKIYFTDNGILNTIGRVNDAQLLENAVVNQLAPYGDLSFYNQRNTAEIDVILDKIVALEIKQTGIDSDYSRVKTLARRLKLKKSLVISKTFVGKDGFLSASQL